MLSLKDRVSAGVLVGLMLTLMFILTCIAPAAAQDHGNIPFDSENLEGTILLTQGVTLVNADGGMRGNLTFGADYIVWTSYYNGSSRIEYLTRSTGEVTSTEITLQALPLRLYGSTLLVDNKVVDLTTGNFQKAQFDYPMGSTAIYGDTVVVSLDVNSPDTPINYDLYQYDLASKTSTALVENQYYQSQPSLWGPDLVWMDARHGLMEVYWMDIDTSDSRRLTINESYKTRPYVQGGKVVWTDFRNTRTIAEDPGENLDIFMYNLITREETQVTTNQGYQNHPKIYGDNIVYNDHRNGNYDVYLYDSSAGLETRITKDNSNQIHPQIWEDIVIWLDDRDSAVAGSQDYNIYQCDLTLDTDGDTQPNYLDLDDDNDGFNDEAEIENKTNPFDELDIPVPTTDPDNVKMAVLIVIIVVFLVFFIAAYVVITQTYTKKLEKKKHERGETDDDSDDDDDEYDSGKARSSKRKGKADSSSKSSGRKGSSGKSLGRKGSGGKGNSKKSRGKSD